MKRTLYVILALTGLLVAAFLLGKPGSLHVPLNLADVRSVHLWGAGGREHAADEETTRHVIEWFNQGTDPRDNEGRAGSTPEAGIRIALKTRHEVGILRSGSDFEVQDERTGKAYWLRQPDLKRMLDELAGAGR